MSYSWAFESTIEGPDDSVPTSDCRRQNQWRSEWPLQNQKHCPRPPTFFGARLSIRSAKIASASTGTLILLFERGFLELDTCVDVQDVHY